jgi:hypothetical protein
MNLTRDLRYVPSEGFAEFAAEEREENRNREWRKFAATAWSASGPPTPAAFDERYPPGFFRADASVRTGRRVRGMAADEASGGRGERGGLDVTPKLFLTSTDGLGLGLGWRIWEPRTRLSWIVRP